MALTDRRQPTQGHRGARRFRLPPPPSVELPRPEDAERRWPAYRAAAGETPPTAQPPAPQAQPRIAAAGAAASSPIRARGPRARTVGQLEAELVTLNKTVSSLERQLAAFARRNQELEAAHGQAAGNASAAYARSTAQRASQLLDEAEARARQMTTEAEASAARVDQQARAHARDLIEAVRSEIDALEQDAQRLREQPATEAAPVEQQAELTRIRGEISDLLRLREAILLNLRGAVAGFSEQLTELERPPLASDSDQPAEQAGTGEAPDPSAGGEADASAAADVDAPPAVELEARPIGGVLDASRIEQELAELAGDAHLRSVEGDTATLQVRGLTPAKLTPALSRRFPDASASWDGNGRMRLTLAPAPTDEPAADAPASSTVEAEAG